MKKILIAVGALLALAGGAGAAELATQSTVTATITVPYTVGGQTGQVVVSKDVQVPTITETVTQTQTVTVTQPATTTTAPPPTTTAPPPTSAPLFDGRATLIDSMRGTTYGTTTGAYMNPRVYNEDIGTYYEDDISLVSDPRFGKVFRIGLNKDSRNPFWVGQPSTKPSAEITTRRPISIGQVDWYALSTKFQADWQAGAWGIVAQFGYPTLTSPPLAIAISKVNGVVRIGIDRHAGIVQTAGSTSGLLNTEPRFFDLSAIAGKWVDWVIGVKWEVDGTGWVIVKTRVGGPGNPWVIQYSVTNTPTWQQQAGKSPKTTVMDKMGAYQDASGLSGDWENVLLDSGITRWSDEASATASLG